MVAMNASRTSLRRAFSIFESSSCLSCQWRSFSISYRRNAEKNTAKNTPPAPAPTTPSTSPPVETFEGAPRAYGKSVDEFTPKPLSKPIGLPQPPRAGENTGIDHRTLKQKRDDFVNYDKHLEKRKQLTRKMSTPYFREWSNMRFSKGKSFLAPPRLFKAEKALYFPNFHGKTLLKEKDLRDTTPTLEGRVSVVSVFSSAWAEKQAASFVSPKENPQLQQVIQGSNGLAQLVEINCEDNAMKAMLINFFSGSLRKRLGKDAWGRYFVVTNGLTDDIKDAIGLLNSKVGYTYLLDGKCRIRWAGSGHAEADEKEGLAKGVTRLIEEARTRKVTAAVKEVSKPKLAEKANVQ